MRNSQTDSCGTLKQPSTVPAVAPLLRWLLLLSAALVLQAPLPILAGTDADKTTLLVIETSQNSAERQREMAFLAELQLTLDRYRVVSDTYPNVSVNRIQNADTPRFSNLSLEQQMNAVRKLANRHRAAAVIWLTENTEEKTIRLHLTALSSGRALIRIVETPGEPDAEVALAMAVNELVGQAYLFDAESPAAAVEASVISATRQQQPGKAETEQETVCAPSAEASLRHRSFLMEGIGRLGIAGNYGPRWTFGGSIGIWQPLPRSLFAAGGLNLISGPYEERTAQKIENLSLAPYVGFGFIRLRHRLSLGAGLFVSIPRQQTVITLASTGTHLYRNWNIRYALRVIFKIPLNPYVALSLSPDFGIWQNQKRFYAMNSQRDIVRNPRLDCGLVVSLILIN